MLSRALLPFVAVTCQEQQLASLSGLQLVTGTTVRDPTTGREQKTGTETWAVVALVCAVFGAFTAGDRHKAARVGGAIAGGVGALSLLLLKAALDNEVMRSGQGMLGTRYLFGYWLALLALIGAAAANVVAASKGATAQRSP